MPSLYDTFNLVSDFQLAGDQARAIGELTDGLGSPEAYYGMMLPVDRGQKISRETVLKKLVEIQYERNDHDFTRGTFRVRGDVIDVYPSYEETGVRLEMFGDEIEEIVSFDPVTGHTPRKHDKLAIFPK